MTTPTASGTKPKRTRFHARIEKAIAHNAANEQRKSFHITYHKQSTKRVVKRKIDPLNIRGGVLVAFDHKRKAIRSFKLERLRHMEKSAFWAGFEKAAISRKTLNSAYYKAKGLAHKAIESGDKKTGTKRLDQAEKFLLGSFQKKGNAAAELAGLGMLAVPSIQHLRGKDMSEDTKSKLEVAGLGTLAAPYAHKAYTTLKPKVHPLLSKLKSTVAPLLAKAAAQGK